MGEPRLQWAEVPVKEEVDTLHCKDKVEAEGLTDCAGGFWPNIFDCCWKASSYHHVVKI
jgi:hypothetical protein